MSEATLTRSDDGRWVLNGSLDFASVPRLWPALEKVLRAGESMILSLSGVSRANSAGLVMLIEALDVARRSGCGVRLTDIPGQLLDLAGMSRCDKLIGGNTL